MDTTDLPALFAHRARPKWGLAILAWEGNDKRRYQFQDGKARTFKEGFYRFLEEVDRPFDVTASVVAELERMLEVSVGRDRQIEQAQATGRTLITLEDQVKIFLLCYPGGFQDPAYEDDLRGVEGRTLKRHLDPAVVLASELFSEERLAELEGKDDVSAFLTETSALLGSTSLTSGKAHAGLFEALPPERGPDFVAALKGLLYAETKVEARFDALVAVLTHGDISPTWQLASAFGALALPMEHIYVRPSVFRDQARWMAPQIDDGSKVCGSVYARYRNMGMRIMKRLREADLKPRDLLDVYGFMWTTLRPKGRELLEEAKAAA